MLLSAEVGALLSLESRRQAVGARSKSGKKTKLESKD
jgi:hypothetical protein